MVDIKREEAEKHRKHLQIVEDLKRNGFINDEMRNWTFENLWKQRKQSEIARIFVEDFADMQKENMGLLFWGNVGTGKSYLAGCIANALMDKEIPVCMTNFTAILHTLENSFVGRNEYIDRLCRYPLLIIDDLGKERGTEYYNCTSYRQSGKQNNTSCTGHYIRYDTLYLYVLARIQHWSLQAKLNEDRLLEQLLKASDKERYTASQKQVAELKKAEKRKAEVDRLFAKMYEDWSASRITEYNFNMLSLKYQTEQIELDEKIEKLKADLEKEQQTEDNAEKWIALIKQYADPTELTAELLNALIEKIVIHEATKGEDGMRDQEIEIYYRFIGKIE